MGADESNDGRRSFKGIKEADCFCLKLSGTVEKRGSGEECGVRIGRI
jgi:hypothetical protein